ncbi:MAG: hypothetical protein ABIW81_01410 [Terrimesophilobacter sp.]
MPGWAWANPPALVARIARFRPGGDRPQFDFLGRGGGVRTHLSVVSRMGVDVGVGDQVQVTLRLPVLNPFGRDQNDAVAVWGNWIPMPPRLPKELPRADAHDLRRATLAAQPATHSGRFPNAEFPFGAVVGLARVADCAVQLRVSEYEKVTVLPYMEALCTDYQLRLAEAVFTASQSVWEVEE